MEWHRIRRGIGGTVLSIALTLGLLEVGVRLWFNHVASDAQVLFYGTLQEVRERGQKEGKALYKFEPHRYIGYVPAANFERDENRHNKWGYRGEEFPKIKPAGEFRIVCLGGSTTYTNFVPDSSLSYPALLQKELRERGYPHVRVINSGVPGWKSYESLINFQLRVLDLRPNMIIVYHGVNDTIARLVYPYRFYQTDNSGYTEHSPGWAQPVALWDRSMPLRMVRIHLGYTRSLSLVRNSFAAPVRSARYWQFMNQIGTGTYPSRIFETFSVRDILEHNRPVAFQRNIMNLLASAQLNGVQPVLATFSVNSESLFPSSERSMNHPDFRVGIEQQNAILKDIGARMGVPVFDFASVFPQERELFSDPVHMTKKGSQVKAKFFADFLTANELVPKGAK